MKELNTLAAKKWEGNYAGVNPTLDSTDGIRNGDIAIDTSLPNSGHQSIWRCCSNAAGNSMWIPVSELEKCITSTGLMQGGLLSINTSSGSTTFDVASGHGLITDQTDPDAPQITMVKWQNMTNVAASYLTSDIRSTIFIDNTGSVYQTNTPVAFQETRDYILLGRLLHGNKSTISQAAMIPRVIYDTGYEADDISTSLGNINISGNTYSYNGANLNINKLSGQSYRLGANYTANPALANVTTDSAGTAISFQYRYRDGLGGFKTSTSTNVIDPNNYDTDTGTPVGIPGSTSAKRWTIQRIYFFPGLGNTFVTYGQFYYRTIAEARNGIITEAPIIDPYLTLEGSLRGYLIVYKGTTALNDTVNNVFVPTGKLGEVMAGGSAGGDVVGPTSAIDNSLARFDSTTGKLIKDGSNIVATDDGYIGIGTISPTAQIHSVVTSNNTGGIGIVLDVYGDNAGAGTQCRRARGTSASPTAVQTFDTLGYISGRGYGATGFSSSGRGSMDIVASETWTDSAQGTEIIFYTTTKGTINRAERLRINGTGQFIGGMSNVASISSNTTASATDLVFICNATSDSININLPSATGIVGKEYVIKKIDNTGNNIIIVGNGGSQTIDGSLSYSINTQYTTTTIVSDGSNWWII